jgi:phosphopantothenoylcysteine synthetase/decarboxylase
MMNRKEVQVVICAAGPAKDVGSLVDQVMERGWAVQPIATQAALELKLVDVEALTKKTGRAVVSTHGQPGETRFRRPDVIIVAPATVNTITKLALGLADTFVAAHLNTAVGSKTPIVILPSLKQVNTNRAIFCEHIEHLRKEGVKILLGEGGIEPTNHSSKDGPLPEFPWDLAVHEAERLML